MELKEVIEKRQSVRQYKPDSVPPELVERIIRLARRAPSAGALRAYKIIVTDQQLTPYEAPVNLIVCALPEKSAEKYGNRGRALYAIQDATIVGAYIQLIAVDSGLSTVWIGAFRESRVKKALELKDGLKPIAIILLGYQQ